MQLLTHGLPLFPMYPKDQQPCCYLGHEINSSNTTAATSQAAAAAVAEDFKTTLKKIDAAPPLPVAAKKLQAVNTMGSSRLNFYSSNLTFTTVKCLDEMESEIVKHVRKWLLNLNNSSNRDFMFSPRAEGGLVGLLSTMRRGCLSFALSVLNSDDYSQVQETARASLSLHMQNKRKVPPACITA